MRYLEYAIGTLLCVLGLFLFSNALTRKDDSGKGNRPAVREANPDLRFYGRAAIPLRTVDQPREPAKQADQVLGA